MKPFFIPYIFIQSLRQVMESTQVSCIIHQMIICTLARV